MFKTALINDEVSQDLTVACALANQYRLDGIEVRSVNEKNPFEMDMADYRAIDKILRDNGLLCAGIASPFFKCNMDDNQTIAQHLEKLKRCVEAANLLGTSIIRGFTFWNDGKGEQSLGRIAQLYQKAVDIAKDGGITIGIESEPSVCTYDSQSLYAFLQELKSETVKALWDPGNEIGDADAPAPYPDGYRLLRPYLCHVHVKEVKRVPGGHKSVLMGQGDVDFHGIFDALRQDDFDGFVSVETHFRFAQALDDATVRRPQGSGFSQGGYEATKAYLDILSAQYGFGKA